MSEFLPMPAAELKAAVESSEYLTLSLPVGSIIAGHEEVWIRVPLSRPGRHGGAPVEFDGWLGSGSMETTGGRELDALLRSGAAKVIRVGHEAVTP